jgi:glutathione S-transferase
VETSYFADPAGKIGFELVAKKRMGLPPNENVVVESLKSLEAFLNVAEKLLQQNEYAAGKQFTLVDIYYIPLVQRLFVCGYGEVITKRKAVNAWWERIVNRPAIAQLLKADRDAMAAMAAAR